MRKIISMILALSMLLCAMTSASAASSYTVSTDATNNAAVKFAECIGEEFDENYFFMADMYPDMDNLEEADYAKFARTEIVNSSNTDAIKVKAGIYMGGEYNTAGLLSDDTLEIQAGQSVSITKGKVQARFPNVDDENNSYTTMGIALTNASELTDDVKVTVNIYVDNEEGTDDVLIASAEYTFVGPVTFKDKNLAAFGGVLTALKQGKDVTADEIANALNMAAESTNTSCENESGDAPEYCVYHQLAQKLDDETIALLAKKLNKANISVESYTFDGLTVSMPYAALADAVGTDDKVYAPIVKEGALPENFEKEEGKEYKALDISLGVNGEELSRKPIVAQKVVVDLPSNFKSNVDTISVLHGDEEIKATVTNGKAEFMTSSFSTFILVGDAITVEESTRATRATIKITQDSDNQNMFTISLVPESNKQIIKYATGGYAIKVQGIDNSATEEDKMETFNYDLTAAEGIVITNDVSNNDNPEAFIGAFTFVASAKDGDLISKGIDEELQLAKLEIKGTGDFMLYGMGLGKDKNDENDRENMFYMETEDDNDSKKAYIEPKSYTFNIAEKKFAVKFNVDFALELNGENSKYANNADYIDITITMTNNVTGEDYKVAIGENSKDAEIDKCIKVNYLDEKATASNVDVTDETDMIKLPAGVTYSLKIEGKGFRTYRDSFHLDEDVTINLWNNALTSEKREVIVNEASTAKEVTFLVGDIYEDGIVDIYDLSAVTAYYNTKEIEADSKYVTYDLDRNGAIDVQDIAWVQMSYGN